MGKSKKRLWIETTTDQEARDSAEAFWGGLHNTVNTEAFWATSIKKDLKNYHKRLEKAIKNFPLPAAFREAAVAVRGMIKDKKRAARNANADYNCDADLKLLYRILSVDSFRLDRAPRANCPGYNIFEIVPGNVLWTCYLDYKKLGFRQMRLCLKTDEKWFVEAWGEPMQHQTLNMVMRDLWDKYEALYMKLGGQWDSMGIYRLM